MKIQILQGINFESNITTIKATFNHEIKEELSIIEEIQSFHPIFLKKYELKNHNELIIQSKLAHLWVEIAKVIDKKIPIEEKRQEILQTVIKRQIKSMSTISILEAADNMNEEITQFLVSEGILDGYGTLKYNRQYTIGCGKRSGTTISYSSSKDSKEAKSIQEDKYLTNLLLERLHIPLAPWDIIESEEHLRNIFEKHKKPIVIKPTSLTAGHGVHTNIHTLEQAIKAYKSAKEITLAVTNSKQKNKILIQQHIPGDDYRLLVINGILEVVTKRVPAFVEGDGKSTIEELIKETNKDPRRDIYNPTHTLKPIKIDRPLIDYLTEQGLNLSHTPKENEKVYVRKVASMSQGGITIDYTDKVHKHIKYVTESIANSLRVYTLGIDVMCKDISKPLNIENGSIIEINTMPEAYLNLYPVVGKQRPEIGTKYVKGLLDNKKTRKVVIISENKRNRPEYEGNTGIYNQNSITINSEQINQNLNTREAIESLKINSYLDNIILHYKNLEEIKEHGFGFDEIDELYFDKKFEKEINKLDKIFIKKYEIFNN